jgi:hypothetical protein
MQFANQIVLIIEHEPLISGLVHCCGMVVIMKWVDQITKWGMWSP